MPDEEKPQRGIIATIQELRRRFRSFVEGPNPRQAERKPTGPAKIRTGSTMRRPQPNPQQLAATRKAREGSRSETSKRRDTARR